jgi:hypothetical protein
VLAPLRVAARKDEHLVTEAASVANAAWAAIHFMREGSRWSGRSSSSRIERVTCDHIAKCDSLKKAIRQYKVVCALSR